MVNSKGAPKTIVLDSGAFITGAKIDRFGPEVRYYTIPEVLAEIKDEKTKRVVETFPYKIEQRQVSAESMRVVSDFAKKTGDLYSLSVPDLKVLALAYMLEKETNGTVNLRSEPQDLLAKKGGLKKASTLPGWDKEPDEEPWVEKVAISGVGVGDAAASAAAGGAGGAAAPQAFAPVTVDDLLFLSAKEFSVKFPVSSSLAEAELGAAAEAEAEAKQAPQTEKKTEEMNAGLGLGPTFCENPSSEGSWITATNLDMHMENMGGLDKGENTKAAEKSSVACITTDFAMQNVMLQMGLRLLSVNGLSISSVRTSMLRCFGCFQTTRDMAKQFCGNCGGHTMVKTWVIVDSRGRARYRWSQKKVSDRRGTKYSIPRPKGGRVNKDLKLREDVLPPDKLYAHKVKKVGNEFSDGMEFGIGQVGKNKATYAIHNKTYGHGRRNPNAVRRTGTAGKKKRNHRRK